ncbi:ABC transporter permease subunit [Sneathiella sp. HT1-7]|uniref:ABC transporter permease subunit n=1 Tax=Sneathiella sp. HT1-7 TaxID=2887192 RepID=UPI001D149558|nr:ABC transporter permease subunit [Sneathiella sp. HT1-7]MCC3306400.1 ABC transporter permease [Sneathiella sp. HT1-7]
MPNMLILAQKEIRDGYRNKWISVMTLVMAGFALVLAFLGSAPVGTTVISPLAVTVVSLSSLGIFFIPLIALLLSYDSIVGEDDRGTLTLLLAYPITRSDIALGKFLGQLFILAFAIIVGYGSATLAIASFGEMPVADLPWSIFLKLVFSSILLGCIFLALGLLLSILTRERGTAAAGAIGIWLVFVVLFDMALLGILSSGASSLIPDDAVKWIMMASPSDAFRMYNLATNNETALLSGMSGLRADQVVPASILLVFLCSWIVIPLFASCVFFQRRAL